VVSEKLCGHTTEGNGFTFRCDLSEGHRGLHAQRTKLRDHIETTNWGDDGLAWHATRGRLIDGRWERER
jgi:hypothetical protein